MRRVTERAQDEITRYVFRCVELGHVAKQQTKVGSKRKSRRTGKRKVQPAPASIRDEIIRYISFGVHEYAASERVGIKKERFLHWMRRGYEALESVQAQLADEMDRNTVDVLREILDPVELPYAVFAVEVDQARGRAETASSMSVQAQWSTDWRAAAWWLERRRGDVYGARDTIRLGVERPAAQMTNGELADELKRLGFVQAPMVQASESAMTLAPMHDPSGLGHGVSASDGSVDHGNGFGSTGSGGNGHGSHGNGASG